MQEHTSEQGYISRRTMLKFLAATATSLAVAVATAPISAAGQELMKNEELPNTRKVIIKGLSPGITVTSIGPAWKALGKQTSQENVPLIFEGVPCVNLANNERGGIWIYGNNNPDANVMGGGASGGIYLPVYPASEGDELILDFGDESPGVGYYQLNLHRFFEEVAKDKRTPRGDKLKIAVIDCGINPNEPQMKSYIETGTIDMSAHEIVNQGYKYDDPHGISVCDIIARYSPGAIKIYPIAITSSGNPGSSTWIQVQNAIQWCIENSVALVNLSWWITPKIGTSDFDSQVVIARQLVQDANKAGVFIIGSAGNEGQDQTATNNIGGHIKNIRVGAMGNGGNVVNYSSSEATLLGPTETQAATLNTNNGFPDKPQRTVFNGTSAASPAVLAVAANMAVYCPEAPMQVIIDAMQNPECTTDINNINSGKDHRDGLGIVDALKLYQYLKKMGY